MMSPSPERPETVADLAPIFSASQRISEQPCTQRQGQTKLLAKCTAGLAPISTGSDSVENPA